MVFDGLDGRVARLTHTQSAFGAEYDSLSDMVSFGAAPALVEVYRWALKDMGRLGWIAAFIYCAGAALRLARFNTNLEVTDKRAFPGASFSGSSVLVAGLVWVMIDHGFSGQDVRWLACVLTLFARGDHGVQFPLLQFQDHQSPRRACRFCGGGHCTGLRLVSLEPGMTLFVFFVLYGLSGYVLAFLVWCAADRRPDPVSLTAPTTPLAVPGAWGKIAVPRQPISGFCGLFEWSQP